MKWKVEIMPLNQNYDFKFDFPPHKYNAVRLLFGSNNDVFYLSNIT